MIVSRKNMFMILAAGLLTGAGAATDDNPAPLPRLFAADHSFWCDLSTKKDTTIYSLRNQILGELLKLMNKREEEGSPDCIEDLPEQFAEEVFLAEKIKKEMEVISIQTIHAKKFLSNLKQEDNVDNIASSLFDIATIGYQSESILDFIQSQSDLITNPDQKEDFDFSMERIRTETSRRFIARAKIYCYFLADMMDKEGIHNKKIYEKIFELKQELGMEE